MPRRDEGVCAPRPGERLDECSREDLTWCRPLAQPGGLDDRDTEPVAALRRRFADREPHSQGERESRLAAVEPDERVMHGDRAADAVDRAREGDHETVAEALDLVAPGLGHGSPQCVEVGLAHALRVSISQPLQQLGGAHQVAEEQRDRRGVHRARPPVIETAGEFRTQRRRSGR